MTRPLHPDTQVQRGDDADQVSREACERGFEPQDAPPRKVMLWVGGVLVLMLAGLGFVALLSTILLGAEDRPRAPFANQRFLPPRPRLLANPPAERRRVEAAARLDPAALDRAKRSLAQSGWGEDAPAPTAQQAARMHAQAVP